MSSNAVQQPSRAAPSEAEAETPRADEAIPVPHGARQARVSDPMADTLETSTATEGRAPEVLSEGAAAVDHAAAASGVPLAIWLARLLQEERDRECRATAGTRGPAAALGGGTPVRRMRVALLSPNRFKTRLSFYDRNIASLARSIRACGVLQPLLVRGRPADLGYEIISGERRWRAAREVGLAEVPVIVLEVDDREAMEIALVDNVQRQDLSLLEESEGYRRLIEEFGETRERLSEIVGKSHGYLANMPRRLRLPEPIRVLFAESVLTIMMHIRNIMKKLRAANRTEAALVATEPVRSEGGH